MSSSVPETIPATGFKAVSAHVPFHGCMHGQKYIDPFKYYIGVIFQSGFHNKSGRMVSGKMIDRLRKKYPGRLDLPVKSEFIKK